MVLTACVNRKAGKLRDGGQAEDVEVLDAPRLVPQVGELRHVQSLRVTQGVTELSELTLEVVDRSGVCLTQ